MATDVPSPPPALSQGAGYGIIIGLGALFAFGMTGVTAALRRYQGEVQTSEQFATASRSVKTGLIAAAVVSSWTWAATLLQSSGVAYRYGVSGPFWYASGATVQILLFAILAIELKRRAPAAHTFFEIIRIRYGKSGHIVFLCFGLATNILVTSMLLTGGSAVASALTGMHTVAAIFLLPIGVIIYTIFGGIKATFLTDYAHTVIIIVILLTFLFTSYTSSDLLGSPGRVWDLLQEVAAAHPVEGNAGGSYLTMRSKEGAVFFVINIVGNFGTVFADNGYFQKAIAANPASALSGYILGGLCWFAVPMAAATFGGLSTLALESNPAFPTYPNRMPDADVSAGLVLPYAAVTLLGKGGAGACLLLVFMAVTSALSSELIAVSSIFTYDIYRTYIKPSAKGREVIFASHASVIGFGIFMACFSTMLYYIEISMGYLYLLMGVIISSVVLPCALALMWSRLNYTAAVFSPVLGFIAAVGSWLGTAKHDFGTLTVASTGSNNPMLVGNCVALLSPIAFIAILIWIKPEKYDFEPLKNIQLVDDSDIVTHDKEAVIGGEVITAVQHIEIEEKQLKKASLIAKSVAGFLTLALLVLWPMPMYADGYVFSKGFFTGWVAWVFIWLFFTAGGVVIYPLVEGRGAIAHTVKMMIRDLQGKKTTPTYTGEDKADSISKSSLPVETKEVKE